MSAKKGKGGDEGEAGAGGGEEKDKKKGRRSDKPLSAALTEAAYYVKDYMTDNQKALSYLRAGKIMHDRGAYRGALECFTEGINANPTTSLFNTRAASYKALNMWSEAYFDYSFAIRMEPDSAAFYCSRGLVLSKMKRWTMAIEDCEIACETQSTPFHHYCKGTVLADFNKNAEAIQDFKACLNFDACPTDLKFKAWYRTGLCHFELKQYDEAVRALTLLLNNDPNSIAPRSLLARAHKMMSDLVKAEEQITLTVNASMSANKPIASDFVERGDIRFRANEKFKCIEAVYDFDKAIDLLHGTVDSAIDDLATYAAEERNHNNPDAKTEQQSSLGANAGEEVRNDMKLGKDTIVLPAPPPALPQTATAGGAGKSTQKLRSTVATASSDVPPAACAKRGGGSVDGSVRSGNTAKSKDGASVMSGVSSKQGSGSLKSGGSKTIPLEEREMGVESEEEEEEEEEEDLEPTFGDDEEEKERKVFLMKQREKERARKLAAKNAPSKKLHQRVDANFLRDAQNQLADAYFRRSQCKQMLSSSNTSQLVPALEDAEAAAQLCPGDDDYQIAVATCYIKLKRFEDAMKRFQIVLKRNPKSEKALYQYAFCQRSVGRNRDAIEGLTKIISTANKAQKSAMSGKLDADYKSTVPLERVYETRGVLFHEIQAHKLALQDLGRAISLNVDKAENYYLRGDCHSKLGNYELALQDFNEADSRGFEDMCSLHSARGMVSRMCGDSHGARRDFEASIQLLHKLNKTGGKQGNTSGVGHLSNHLVGSIDKEDGALLEVRLSSLRALCFLDVGMYNAGHQVLVNAVVLITEMEESLLRGKTITDAIISIERRVYREEKRIARAQLAEVARLKREKEEAIASKSMAGRAKAAATAAAASGKKNITPGDEGKGEGDKESKAGETVDSNGEPMQSTEPPTPVISDDEQSDEDERLKDPNFQPDIDGPTLCALRRLKWILLYHSALAMHMQQQYHQAYSYLVKCTDITMLAAAPDDLVLGMVWFFMGVQLSQIGNVPVDEDVATFITSEDRVEKPLEVALECFEIALQSKWGSVDKNSTLINFSKGKLFQQMKRHKDAVATFDRSIVLDPQNAHAYFRRAWSHKALGGTEGITAAGADFETAKKIRWDDPNFAVDYKRIAQFEYMALESEPDVQFVFPSLLPKPGSSLSTGTQRS